MFVKCSSKHASDFQKKDLDKMNIIYGGDVIGDLDIDRQHLVYAVATINGVKNYLLYDISLSSDFEEWGWFPAVLFETTDERNSQYWKEYHFKNTEGSEYFVSHLSSHESFSKLSDLYVGVCERREDIVKDFHGMKEKYDFEFKESRS